MPRIERTTRNKERFLDLLLLADEQEDMVQRYLPEGELYAGRHRGNTGHPLLLWKLRLSAGAPGKKLLYRPLRPSHVRWRHPAGGYDLPSKGVVAATRKEVPEVS